MVEEYIERRATKEKIEKTVNTFVRQGLINKMLAELIVEALAKEAEFRITRKFVASVYILKLAEAAEQRRISRKKALYRIGKTYATMVAGDGNIRPPSDIDLTIGDVFGDAVALLVAVALYKAGRLAPERFKPYVYKKKGKEEYFIRTHGDHMRALGRLLAATAPSVKGEYLIEKFDRLMELAKPSVKMGKPEKTKTGFKTTLTLELQGQSVTFSVYFGSYIRLFYETTNKERLELAARLLRLAGVKKVEVKEGYIQLTTDALASAGEEFRKELLKAVEQIEKIIESEGAADER